MNELNNLLVISPLYNKSKIFIEALPEVSDDTQDPGEIKGDIEINKLSFKYKHGHSAILKDINLHISPGDYVAIVGKSGSGKSTLLRLLLGFEVPSNGRIYFDSKDTATLDYNLIRRQFGVVLQHDELNPGNIFSNISGISDLTIDEAWEIAEKAGIAKDILDMPMQMNTIINLEGSGLSGGQKQRLLIARAIARDPKVLILDEATRALDNVTQRMVIDSLSKMKMTRIVVAHRLSTLVQVDKIFVLSDGQIVEMGNYSELLNKKGHFYSLVQKQLV
jgi:ATP-binding cassette subfamily C protein